MQRWDVAVDRDELGSRTKERKKVGRGRGYSLGLGGDNGGDGGNGEERELHGRLVEMGELWKVRGRGGLFIKW